MIGSVIALAGREPVAAVVASAVVVAAGAGVVIATTGALAEPGLYDIELTAGISGVAAAGKHIVFEHRNAADNATLQSYGLCPGGAGFSASLGRISIAANERIRALNGIIGGAGEAFQACIRATKVA
jgi:hypothetical protein